MKNESLRQTAEVIVIGAGIAGLSVARTLAEAGKAVILLEAANRIGGRMRSCAIPNVAEPIELGAEFIHGMPQDLFDLLRQAKLETYEVTGRPYSWDGISLAVDEDESDEDTEILDHIGDHFLRDSAKDLSFSDYMDDRGISGAARVRLAGYVEGFNAADIFRISTQALGFQQAAENSMEGDRVFHVRRGYSALADHVLARYEAAGGKLMLQHPVTGIQWFRKKVTVTGAYASGDTFSFTGRRVVLAVPLGVHQAGTITVDPWPESFNAIWQMAMGRVHRIVLIFRDRFWTRPPHDAVDLNFLFAQQATPSVWWTAYPAETPMLTGWIGGTRVEETATVNLLETTLSSLSRIFHIARPDLDALLVSSHTHDWNHDPLSHGAYSYVCTGGIKASSALSLPIDGTVFMAGEHTDVSGHWGTVHGALRSGMRAASQVLESLHGSGRS